MNEYMIPDDCIGSQYLPRIVIQQDMAKYQSPRSIQPDHLDLVVEPDPGILKKLDGLSHELLEFLRWHY